MADLSEINEGLFYTITHLSKKQIERFGIVVGIVVGSIIAVVVFIAWPILLLVNKIMDKNYNVSVKGPKKVDIQIKKDKKENISSVIDVNAKTKE